MHLTAYLGYLLGTNGDKKCKYVIISKDNDYDNVITFLKEIHRSADIARHPKMDYTASAKKKKCRETGKNGTDKPQKAKRKNSSGRRSSCSFGEAGHLSCDAVKHNGSAHFEPGLFQQ